MICTQLLGFLLLVCEIIFNESSVIPEDNHAVVRRDTSTFNETPNLPEGYTRFPQVNAAYKVHDDVPKYWREGRDVCISEGAHLAIADTQEKIDLISSVTSKRGFHWIHVGFYKRDNRCDQWFRIDNNQTVTPESLPFRVRANIEGDCSGITARRQGLWDYQCDSSTEWFACEIAI